MSRLKFIWDKEEEKEEEKPGWLNRTRGIGELPELPISTKLKFTSDVGVGVGATATGGISLPGATPKEEDFSTPLGKVQYYESKIDWLEGIAKEKGYLDESGYDAYRYAIEQYNKALKEYKVNQPLIEGLPMSKPEDKFPGFEIVEDTKISAYTPQEKTLWNKVGDLLKGIPKIGGETPEAINARAQVSLNISQQTGIPATTVNQNLDKITKELGIRGIPTTGEFISEVIKYPIIYAIVTNPVYTTIRIGEFLALTEGINKVGSLMGKWEYKFMSGKGVKDLLPEETNQFTKDVVGVAEFLGKAYLIGKFNKSVASLKLWDKFTKDLISEYHLPQRVVISAKDSKLITIDEFNKMGIKGEQVLSARERGIDIEVPLIKVVKFTDKPWWGSVKGFFGIKPYSKITAMHPMDIATAKPHTFGLLGQPATTLYGGLPIDKIAGAIMKSGKVSAEWVKGLTPDQIALIAKQLTPALASEFLKAVEKPEAKEPIPAFKDIKNWNTKIDGKLVKDSWVNMNGEEMVSLNEPGNETSVHKYNDLKAQPKPIEKKAVEKPEAISEPAKVTPPVESKEGLEAEVKAPWEMTRNEVVSKGYIGIDIKTKEYKLIPSQKGNDNNHEAAVAKALSEGKSVPAEVLADYPDLKAEPKTPAIPAELEGLAEEAKVDTRPFAKLLNLDKLANDTYEIKPSDRAKGTYDIFFKGTDKLASKFVNVDIKTAQTVIDNKITDKIRKVFKGEKTFEEGEVKLKETFKEYLTTQATAGKAEAAIPVTEKPSAAEPVAEGQVYYHGSDVEIDKFDISKVEKWNKFGHFFSPDKEAIKLYGDVVNQATVNVTNPKVITQKQWWDIRGEHAKDDVWFTNWKKELISQGYNGLKVKPSEEQFAGETVKNPEILVAFEDSQVKVVKPTTPVAEKATAAPAKAEVKVEKPYLLNKELTLEQRIEGNKLIGQIHKVVNQKGLTGVEFADLKRKYGLSPHLATATKRMTIPQLEAVLKAVEKARPKRIGWKDVITPKTERKIQSLKDNLIDKLQMTEEAYTAILKSEGVYKEPKYIDGKNFITEKQGKDIIYRLIGESDILRETLPYDKAVKENPVIQKLIDKEKGIIGKYRDRGLKDPKELNSARVIFQKMEEITGAPIYRMYQSLIDISLENKEKAAVFLHDFEEYKDIIKDEKAIKRVADYITSKSNLKNKPEYPKNITEQEIKMAKKIEGILKDYRAKARTEKFLEDIDFPQKIPQYEQYKKEIDKAKDIYEGKGYDDLVEYMKTQEWGIIRNGYDPLQVVSNEIRMWKPKPQTFGKSHIKVRTDIEYHEQDKNVLERLFSYKKQMDNLVDMRPKVRAFITLIDENIDKFHNPQRIKEGVEIFLRELKGYNRPEGLVERELNRAYAQAMQVIILPSPVMFARNILQPIAFGFDKTAEIDPRNKKLTADEIDYMNTYVSQMQAMKIDWFMVGEKPYFGRLGAGLMKLVNKVGIYPYSDQSNRHRTFWAKINQVHRAFADIDKNSTEKQLSKAMGQAKFNDMERTERIMALEILAKDGKEAMARYMARVFTADTQFQYNRAERSFAEMGRGKWLTNLMLFPRSYNELLLKQLKHFKEGTPGQKARAFKVLISIIVGGILVGEGYKKVTGRRENPYSPLTLLAYEPGGLAIGTVEAISDVYSNTILAVGGNERALAALTTAIPRLADMWIPFYDYTIRGYEAATNQKNVDVRALRRIRELLDSEYKTRGDAYEIERNAMQKLQYLIAGAGVDTGIREREAEITKEPLKITIPKGGKLKFTKPKLNIKSTKIKFNF